MSRTFLPALLLSLLPCLSMAAANDQTSTPSAALAFSIIKTAEASTLDGLFLNMTSGDRYFFVGDVVWNVDALDHVSPKPLVASVIVDNERQQTLAAVAKVALTRELITGLIVVPAHDKDVHDTLGYFPNWVE
ncbi:MAG: hypothetical protein ACSHXK_12905 [Oceanococcus sp.]